MGEVVGYEKEDEVVWPQPTQTQHRVMGAPEVKQPADIRPALERAFASGRAAIVNVKTDLRARATTMRFTDYTT